MTSLAPRRALLTLASLATFAAAACSSASDSISAGGDQRTDAQLNLLTVTADAPTLATPSVSFWAVKGKNAGTDIWYKPRPGQRDSTKLLEFRLGGATLDRRPDGTSIVEGDSVRITVTVTDPAHLIVDFQPSGLIFSSKDPAKLRMFFAECGDDLDRNGVVNSGDTSIAQQLSIWRREAVGLPWVKQASLLVNDSKRVDAELGGFSGYALAF